MRERVIEQANAIETAVAVFVARVPHFGRAHDAALHGVAVAGINTRQMLVAFAEARRIHRPRAQRDTHFVLAGSAIALHVPEFAGPATKRATSRSDTTLAIFFSTRRADGNATHVRIGVAVVAAAVTIFEALRADAELALTANVGLAAKIVGTAADGAALLVQRRAFNRVPVDAGEVAIVALRAGSSAGLDLFGQCSADRPHLFGRVLDDEIAVAVTLTETLAPRRPIYRHALQPCFASSPRRALFEQAGQFATGATGDGRRRRRLVVATAAASRE
jgi:hypothetical protein